MSRRREKQRIADGGLPPGAVRADVSKQVPVSPYGSSKTFYVDVDFNCVDCGSNEVWTAQQQKQFYEVEKGSLYKTAVRCRPCRALRNQELASQRQQLREARSKREANDR